MPSPSSPSARLRLVTSAPASHVANSAPISPRFADYPALDVTEAEADMRGGRTTAAVLVGFVVMALTFGCYLVARWSAPEPRGVPCGKTMRVKSGAEVLIVCDDSDEPRSND